MGNTHFNNNELSSTPFSQKEVPLSMHNTCNISNATINYTNNDEIDSKNNDSIYKQSRLYERINSNNNEKNLYDDADCQLANIIRKNQLSLIANSIESLSSSSPNNNIKKKNENNKTCQNVNDIPYKKLDKKNDILDNKHGIIFTKDHFNHLQQNINIDNNEISKFNPNDIKNKFIKSGNTISSISDAPQTSTNDNLFNTSNDDNILVSLLCSKQKIINIESNQLLKTKDPDKQQYIQTLGKISENMSIEDCCCLSTENSHRYSKDIHTLRRRDVLIERKNFGNNSITNTTYTEYNPDFDSIIHNEISPQMIQASLKVSKPLKLIKSRIDNDDDIVDNDTIIKMNGPIMNTNNGNNNQEKRVDENCSLVENYDGYPSFRNLRIVSKENVDPLIKSNAIIFNKANNFIETVENKDCRFNEITYSNVETNVRYPERISIRSSIREFNGKNQQSMYDTMSCPLQPMKQESYDSVIHIPCIENIGANNINYSTRNKEIMITNQEILGYNTNSSSIIDQCTMRTTFKRHIDDNDDKIDRYNVNYTALIGNNYDETIKYPISLSKTMQKTAPTEISPKNDIKIIQDIAYQSKYINNSNEKPKFNIEKELKIIQSEMLNQKANGKEITLEYVCELIRSILYNYSSNIEENDKEILIKLLNVLNQNHDDLNHLNILSSFLSNIGVLCRRVENKPFNMTNDKISSPLQNEKKTRFLDPYTNTYMDLFGSDSKQPNIDKSLGIHGGDDSISQIGNMKNPNYELDNDKQIPNIHAHNTSFINNQLQEISKDDNIKPHKESVELTLNLRDYITKDKDDIDFENNNTQDIISNPNDRVPLREISQVSSNKRIENIKEYNKNNIKSSAMLIKNNEYIQHSNLLNDHSVDKALLKMSISPKKSSAIANIPNENLLVFKNKSTEKCNKATNSDKSSLYSLTNSTNSLPKHESLLNRSMETVNKQDIKLNRSFDISNSSINLLDNWMYLHNNIRSNDKSMRLLDTSLKQDDIYAKMKRDSKLRNKHNSLLDEYSYIKENKQAIISKNSIHENNLIRPNIFINNAIHSNNNTQIQSHLQTSTKTNITNTNTTNSINNTSEKTKECLTTNSTSISTSNTTNYLDPNIKIHTKLEPVITKSQVNPKWNQKS